MKINNNCQKSFFFFKVGEIRKNIVTFKKEEENWKILHNIIKGEKGGKIKKNK